MFVPKVTIELPALATLDFPDQDEIGTIVHCAIAVGMLFDRGRGLVARRAYLYRDEKTSNIFLVSDNRNDIRPYTIYPEVIQRLYVCGLIRSVEDDLRCSCLAGTVYQLTAKGDLYTLSWFEKSLNPAFIRAAYERGQARQKQFAS